MFKTVGVSDFGDSIFVLVSANFIKSGDIRISNLPIFLSKN